MTKEEEQLEAIKDLTKSIKDLTKKVDTLILVTVGSALSPLLSSMFHIPGGGIINLAGLDIHKMAEKAKKAAKTAGAATSEVKVKPGKKAGEKVTLHESGD